MPSIATRGALSAKGFGFGFVIGGPFLWTWGSNGSGQLGLGNVTYYSSPKQVGALTTWLSVAGGYPHTIATKTDGTLWTWGHNYYGQLGLDNTTQYNSPKQVGALTTWKTIAGGGYHTIAI